MQGRSIGRILYTRALSQTRAGNHSSRHVVTHMLKPPTRILGRTTPSGRSRTYAYLVLLRMEVAAFHPLPAREATRLCGPVPRLCRHREASAGAAGRYPASRSVEPGLSSPSSVDSRQRRSGGLRRAIIRLRASARLRRRAAARSFRHRKAGSPAHAMPCE